MGLSQPGGFAFSAGSQRLAFLARRDLPAARSHVAGALCTEAAEELRPYDLALLDRAMPGMDSLELAETVCADPELDSVRL